MAKLRKGVSYIGNQEVVQMMQWFAVKEDKGIYVVGPELILQHNEIMDEANRQLLHDLAMEQRETM